MAEVEWHKRRTTAGGCWGEIVLNRPERKNAITGPLGIHLTAALSELGSDQEVQAILLRGAGAAFCSGLDLKAFNADPAPEWLQDFQSLWRATHLALFNCDVPVIGALERYAINGGAALAFACDYLIVGEQAFVQVGEVQIGMAAPYNLAWLNLRHNEAVVAELALIGDRASSSDMLRLGLANQSVPDDQVVAIATDLCERMADFPTGAPRNLKQVLRARLQETPEDWFDRHKAAAIPLGKPRAMTTSTR
ncbi:MAG: enoyl-CoA hydratase/isomerase family protein [Pseudomonadales bacterium]